MLLLERRQNGTHIADWLPARAHDAINRLLRLHALSTRALMGDLIEWAKRLEEGYPVIYACNRKKPLAGSRPPRKASRSPATLLPLPRCGTRYQPLNRQLQSPGTDHPVSLMHKIKFCQGAFERPGLGPFLNDLGDLSR